MLSQKVVSEQLDEIRGEDDLITRIEQLAAEWEKESDGFVAVEPILRFMELNPGLELGLPGPLVHFVERFYGQGYEEKLVQSIERHPVMHTVWMLNRVINGAKDAVRRALYVALLKKVSQQAEADSRAVELAARLVERLAAA